MGVLALLAVALASPVLAVTVPTDATPVYDVHAQRFVTETTLVDALASARLRLLGEIHDDPEHHEIRARLLHEMAGRGSHPAVVMEQFDFDHDASLRAAQRAHADPDRIATAGALDRKGWQWPLHRPIVAQALASDLPLRAGNLSRAALSGNLDAVLRARPRLAKRLHAAAWTNGQAKALQDDIAAGHCNMLPDAIVPKLALAQRMRDAAMAQALVDDATADGAVLIAGNGHVRNDLGVPVYLHAPGLPGAQARSISVGFLEASADEMRAEGFPQPLIASNPGFDYVVVTPPIARPDPCEAFRRAR